MDIDLPPSLDKSDPIASAQTIMNDDSTVQNDSDNRYGFFHSPLSILDETFGPIVELGDAPQIKPMQ